MLLYTITNSHYSSFRSSQPYIQDLWDILENEFTEEVRLDEERRTAEAKRQQNHYIVLT